MYRTKSKDVVSKRAKHKTCKGGLPGSSAPIRRGTWCDVTSPYIPCQFQQGEEASPYTLLVNTFSFCEKRVSNLDTIPNSQHTFQSNSKTQQPRTQKKPQQPQPTPTQTQSKETKQARHNTPPQEQPKTQNNTKTNKQNMNMEMPQTQNTESYEQV